MLARTPIYTGYIRTRLCPKERKNLGVEQKLFEENHTQETVMVSNHSTPINACLSRLLVAVLAIAIITVTDVANAATAMVSSTPAQNATNVDPSLNVVTVGLGSTWTVTRLPIANLQKLINGRYVSQSTLTVQIVDPRALAIDVNGKLASLTTYRIQISGRGTVTGGTTSAQSQSFLDRLKFTTGAAMVPTPSPSPTPSLTVGSSISNGATLSGTSVIWTANVSNSTGVSKIDFLIDDLVKWTALSAPYQFNGAPDGRLDTTKLTNGAHALKLNATKSDNSVVSYVETVTVSNTTPALSGPLPADRKTLWAPGMNAVGGIPTRTSVCAVVSASSYGNGSLDASAGIQAAIDGCPAGQVVSLSAGTFTVNTYLLINKGITLRGAGAGLTLLTKTNGARARIDPTHPVDPSTYTYDPSPIVVIGPTRWPGPDQNSSTQLSADGVKGSYAITVTSASGYAAGQFVLLDEVSGASWKPVPAGFGCAGGLTATPCPPLVWQGDKVAWNMHWPTQQWQDDNANSDVGGPYDTTPGTLPNAMSWFSRTDRPTNEIKEIAAVSGNTITFTTPLHIDYRTSHTAQLTGYSLSESQGRGNSMHVKNAGIEDLSTVGGADGQIRFENAAYSWAKAVEVSQWIGEGFAVNGSFRVEIRDSYGHDGSWPTPGGAGYIISFADGSSEILVENNILTNASKEMVVRSSGAGSVFAYNYTDDAWISYDPGWVEVGLNASHMAGPHHVLFEGNYSQNIDSDYTHGNAIDLTFFRNWVSGQRRSFTDASNIRTVGLAYGSWWDSFIGNVFGRSGQMSGWTYEADAMSGNNANWTDKVIWKLGYDPERWGMFADPLVLATVIRDGNFDYLTNAVHWHTTPSGYVIPNSLYLASKPSFFGSYTWPWVDAGGTTKLHTLPAKARYDAGTPFAVAP
jgi:hypothetical protein